MWKEEHEKHRNLRKNSTLLAYGKLDGNRGIYILHFHMSEVIMK